MASAHELRTATLVQMTESIAKEFNECLSAIVINSSTCLRRRIPQMSREHARRRDGRFAVATVQRKQSHG